MGGEWQLVKLGELVTHHKGFAFKSKDYREKGHPIARVSNFTDRSIDVSDFNFIEPEQVQQYEGYKLKTRDVVVATVGSWPTNPASVVGKAIQVPASANDALLNQNAVRLRADIKMDQVFLFHLLKSDGYQNYIVSTAQGSANQASITLKSIFDFSFYLPSIPEQRVIANILGSLDDKIELNCQMNETLEAMAQALFKSWFVDFDPVIDNALAAGHPISDALKAKTEARQALGDNRKPLPEALRQQFPSRFEFSEERGWIPEGWAAINIGSITEQRREKAKKQAVTVLSAVASGELVQSDKYFTKQVHSKTTEKYLVVHKWDFAYNPSRINIGSIGMLKSSFVGAVSPVYVVAKPRYDCRWFLEFYIRGGTFKNWVKTLASGSVRQSLTYSDFAAIPCVIPTGKILREFNDSFEERRLAVLSNLAQNDSLEALRGVLLPKLLSGELRIPDAEKLVASAL